MMPPPAFVQNIVLAAGGTAGHMFPAQALAQILINQGHNVTLITDSRGNAFGDQWPSVPCLRIRGQKPTSTLLGKVKALVGLGLGLWDAYWLLRKNRPHVVVGFGGYPSLPTVLAAQFLGLRTVVHEQNAVLGRANRLLSKRASVVATAFPHVHGASDSKTIVVGNPLRPAILALKDEPYSSAGPSEDFHLLVTGGSQGAAIFSQVVPQAVAALPPELRQRLHIVQQARPEDVDNVREAYADLQMRVTVQNFFTDMAERMKWAHLVISRSGSTVLELATAGRPCILVPYPAAMDNHQTANARQIVGSGGGWHIPQAEFTPNILADRLKTLMAQPDTLSLAAHRIRTLSQSHAAENLARVVLNTPL